MKRYFRFIAPLLILVIFAVALWLLHRELEEYHLRDVIASLRKISCGHLVLAVLLTVLNYSILVGYDLLGTWQIGHRLPLKQVAFASFVGYVSSNNFGA